MSGASVFNQRGHSPTFSVTASYLKPDLTNQSASFLSNRLLTQLMNGFLRFAHWTFCDYTNATARPTTPALCEESEHLEGHGNIPGRVLKECADQLAGVLTDIFNTSLQQAVVPLCFKTAIVIPVPKNHNVLSQ